MLLAGLLVLFAGCRPEKTGTLNARRFHAPVENLSWFTQRQIGKEFRAPPWISNVCIADLDQDGLGDVVATDDRENSVVWLRQERSGLFSEKVIADEMSGPVHAEVVDLDSDGDMDLGVACMGELFPNNDKIGSIVLLENRNGEFRKHLILSQVARVTDVRAGDFDGDGRLDLAVAQFGYDQGEVRWLRNLGNWQFESHVLLSLSGAINVCVADFNADRTLDFVVLISQQWEEIHFFANNGHGVFDGKIIFGSTNEDFGSSGISVCDLNRDGRPDILYTNGDGFAYADPGTRPWHGLQWMENVGQGNFIFHRIADLSGAYSPVGVDLDGDGDMDVVCTSAFNDWSKPTTVALAAFLNDGQMSFTEHVLARAPIQLISCAAGDIDGSGRPVIVTAGFYSYPPFDRMARITLWQQQ